MFTNLTVFVAGYVDMIRYATATLHLVSVSAFVHVSVDA